MRISNIHGLAAVEPVAETGVECCRERDDELARPLYCRHNSQACDGKQKRSSGVCSSCWMCAVRTMLRARSRRDQCGEPVQQVGRLPKERAA